MTSAGPAVARKVCRKVEHLTLREKHLDSDKRIEQNPYIPLDNDGIPRLQHLALDYPAPKI
jgi:hypothetical protein